MQDTVINNLTFHKHIEYWLKDILGVGFKKPMGYLPISYLKKYSLSSVEMVIIALKTKGIMYKRYTERQCRIGSGAVYAYHNEALQQLLDKNESVLKTYNWPTAADSFVEKVATEEDVRGIPPLFDLIVDAFGDKRNPGRSDYVKRKYNRKNK